MGRGKAGSSESSTVVGGSVAAGTGTGDGVRPAPSEGRAGPELSRRLFLALTGAGSLGLFLRGPLGGAQLVSAAPVPGGALVPGDIPKFVTPLLVPPVMPRAGTFERSGGPDGDYYEISMRQFAQQILPAGMPTTTVWGYGAVKSRPAGGLLIHNAPSLTIEAKWNTAGAGQVDQRPERRARRITCRTCCRSTRPCTGPTRRAATMERDMRPDLRRRRPARYTGPVPMVTHVHGSVGVGMRATDTPRRGTCPRRQHPRRLCHGRDLVRLLQGQGCGEGLSGAWTAAWEPGTSVFQYPNTQRASTIWYHDHTLGMTRLNVYAGPAGFFIIRGGPAGDSAVLDSRTGSRPCCRGPAPKERDKFPPEQDLLRDPDRDPGSRVQRRRLAVLPGHAAPSSTGSPDRTSRETDRLADLEPGVLRQHHHGERQHLAVPEC